MAENRELIPWQCAAHDPDKPCARELFSIGDRVQLTAKAFKENVGVGQSTTGIVIGFAKKPYSLRVRSNGYKSPVTYYMDFWEKIMAENDALKRDITAEDSQIANDSS